MGEYPIQFVAHLLDIDADTVRALADKIVAAAPDCDEFVMPGGMLTRGGLATIRDSVRGWIDSMARSGRTDYVNPDGSLTPAGRAELRALAPDVTVTVRIVNDPRPAYRR